MSNSKQILSINEENTIFITARFIASAMQNGTNQKIADRYYDLELIVNHNITCNRLMDAIRMGLEEKFNDIEIYKSFKIDDFFKEHYNPNRNYGDDNIFKKSKDKSELEIYAICLRIYLECYNQFYKKIKIVDSIDSDCPSISRGFVNLGEISDGQLIGSKLYLTEEEHGSLTLKELGFVSSSHINFDWPNVQSTGSLFKEDEAVITQAFQNRKPRYNISDTPLYKLDVEPIRIIPPTEPPKKNKMNILISVLSPLLMTGAMFVARSFSSIESSINYLPMMIATIITSIVISIINIVASKKNYKESLEEWKKHYEDYIVKIINDIINKQKWDVEQLNLMYPPVFPNLENVKEYEDQDFEKEKCLCNMIREIDGNIYSRNQQHPNYMEVRLGISSKKSQLVKSIFEIKGEKQDVIFSSARYNQVTDMTKAFNISLPKGDSDDPYLIDLPSDIASKYAYLHGAPVLLNIKKCGTVGLVFDEGIEFQPFLENIILNLCFYQSPEDIQFVYFAESFDDYCIKHPKSNISKWEYEQQKIEKFKHLSHFRELLTDNKENKDISSFAFDKDNASKILNKILEILSNRFKEGEEINEKRKFPQIIMIFEDEYDFKRHPVSEYLREYNGNEKYVDYGINFVFCKRHFELLPKYCGQVVRATKDKKWFLLPHSQLVLRNDDSNSHDICIENYEFICDSFDKADIDFREIHNRFNSSFKILSALYYDRIEQAGGVPSSVKLFEMINKMFKADNRQKVEDEQKIDRMRRVEDEQITANSVKELEKLRKTIDDYIRREWGYDFIGTRNVTESLAVPIGCRNDLDLENSLVTLDLHEKEDGPHMLVAGTTGSGKTETILTYLIMLCMHYSPKQVNLLLMDMKGAGFVKRIGNLPHVVGKVTDVDGDENGTSMEYMLRRFLKSMSSEVKRRKLMLSKMGVDAIDAYTEAKNNIEVHIDEILKLNPNNAANEYERAEIERKIEEIKQLEDMPHLFLVIDEFTELMRFSSDNSDIDFKSEITSLARIGRSLGFHIILISQNIEGAITSDIRVNSKARLCLKVATREASKEMIGRDLAASPLMPGNGRAYLLIGTGSRFEYFQSAYSGAYCVENNEQRVIVTEVRRSGENILLYDSNDAHKDELQLEYEEDLQRQSRLENKTTNHKIKDKSDKKQISVIAEEIEKIGKDIPVHKVFQSPLPRQCYYDFNNRNNKVVVLNKNIDN